MKKAKEETEDTNNERRLADMEGVEEERELAKKRSQRYQQRMTKAYAQAEKLMKVGITTLQRKIGQS